MNNPNVTLTWLELHRFHKLVMQADNIVRLIREAQNTKFEPGSHDFKDLVERTMLATQRYEQQREKLI